MSDSVMLRSMGAPNEGSLPEGAAWFTLRLLLVVDAALLPALLVVDGVKNGGSEADWFSDQATHYSFKTSSFDLALAALVRGVALLAVFWRASDIAVATVSAVGVINGGGADAPPPRWPRRRAVVAAAVALLASVALAAVKAGVAGGSLHGNTSIGWAIIIAAIALPCLEAAALRWVVASAKHDYAPVANDAEAAAEEEDGGEGALQKAEKRATIRRLLRLAGPEVPIIAAGLCALVVSSAAYLSIPYLFGVVIDAMKHDTADHGHARRTLSHSIFKLIGAAAAFALTAFLRNWLFTLAGQRVLARLMKQVFASIMAQEVGFFDKTRTGELTNRLSNDCTAIQTSITVNISMLSRFTAQLLGALVIMFVLSARLTGVMLSVVPVVVAAAISYGSFVKRVRRQYQDALAGANAIAEECIAAKRTVRSLHGEPRAMRDYDAKVDLSLDYGKKLALAGGGFIAIVGTVAQASVTLTLWYGGTLVIDGHLSTGRLTSFLLYTITVSAGFSVLSSLYGSFMQAVGASVRVFELLDRKPAVVPGAVVPADGDSGRVVVRINDVSFSYPTRPSEQVLSGIDFELVKGEVTALVGPSGGGKSTIVALIERFYDPTGGSISVAGHDLRELSPAWLHKRVALVAQEPVLFACSILDNIRFGRPDASEEEVKEAAKMSNAHSFVSKFAEGYQTLVGERGVRLSGGQKQRIAIARALIADPELLLLDEATSALDAESEHLVQEAIDRAMHGRTVLVIAHRLSTVRGADVVLVVDGGKVVERGNHDALVEAQGLYARLVRRQMLTGDTHEMARLS